MGRDWAPIEHYMSEQEQLKQGRGDLFDFMDGLKLVYPNGETKSLHTPEEMAIRRQFPQLGRLLMDDFMVLYERLTKISGGLDFLHKKDKDLADFIGAIRTDKEGSRYVVKIEGENIDMDSYLVKWFTGRLDERFYYSECNNSLFVEAMISDAMTLNREPFDADRFEAALEYCDLDDDDENRAYFEAHANKLIYIAENGKDLLDFDFWVQYELLLGEKITWPEYVAIDNNFDGDPLDVSLKESKTIQTFKESLGEFRSKNKSPASLEANIKAAECEGSHKSSHSPNRDNSERDL